nr:unnamed protein product [Digitaria exilis]
MATAVAFMERALEQAKFALDNLEVPVGCVIVEDGKVISSGSNRTNATRNMNPGPDGTPLRSDPASVDGTRSWGVGLALGEDEDDGEGEFLGLDASLVLRSEKWRMEADSAARV